MSEPVLSVRNLRTQFKTRAGTLNAVDGVSFEVGRGRILGLVGESGSGKSVTGYSILGLIEPPGMIADGEVLLNGRDLTRLKGDELRRVRGAQLAMVFQDPMMTLNPVLKIGTQMIAAVRAHDNVSRRAARVRAREALAKVGIPSPEERLDAYPHQLSGGMRQRVAIAIALLHRPAVIIADEPTTALDVSIQGQILAEVRRLADETGTAFVWVTHDLAVVSSLADDICVMYAGRVVETGPAAEVIAAPRHPYTAGLLASVPAEHEPGERLPQVPGSAPSLANLPPGCAFAPRCFRAGPACTATPPVQRFADGRSALCHYPIETDSCQPPSSTSTTFRSAS
ncbi:ABC transporter ATP-binding protein [Microvirga thermotolerans]|uniref:ATP-binding cassette domain-containing protein n=1 Tax=Microvirga thermotolerans TaxID=2651334 RepID=A0A5P9JSS3_9HYPH|nr:ABC transporter ATP-binding protein [Microvirga thermotolerans]QFU15139.1 ATP-binding cassette domain-containing protein [Microvirga thermotolerans]